MTNRVQCTVLRRFSLSYNGITAVWLDVEDEIEVPENMVVGLCSEGFVALSPRSFNPVAETAVHNPVTETKTDTGDEDDARADTGDEDDARADETPPGLAAQTTLDNLRATYRGLTGEKPNHRWSAEMLRQKIIEA